MTKGYGTLCTTTSTFSTTLSAMWIITWTMRCTQTRTRCRIEHTCMPSVVALLDLLTSSHWLKADLICLFTFIPSMHMCLRPSVLFSSFSPSTSCSTSPCSFSCFSPWWTATPWTWTPCVTSLTGPSLPWTTVCPTHLSHGYCWFHCYNHKHSPNHRIFLHLL